MTAALRILATAALTLLVAGCGGQPRAGLGIGIGPGGVSVSPVIGTTIGGVGLSVGSTID